jgi:hypothetical protein
MQFKYESKDPVFKNVKQYPDAGIFNPLGPTFASWHYKLFKLVFQIRLQTGGTVGASGDPIITYVLIQHFGREHLRQTVE